MIFSPALGITSSYTHLLLAEGNWVIFIPVSAPPICLQLDFLQSPTELVNYVQQEDTDVPPGNASSSSLSRSQSKIMAPNRDTVFCFFNSKAN